MCTCTRLCETTDSKENQRVVCFYTSTTNNNYKTSKQKQLKPIKITTTIQDTFTSTNSKQSLLCSKFSTHAIANKKVPRFHFIW